MKNILLLVPRMNIGGSESYTATVASELLKLGYNVFLVSGGGKLAKELEAKGVKTFFLPLRLNATIAAFFLTRIVKQYKIELIHANSAAAGFVAAKVKAKLGVPVVYTAHGIFSKQEYDRGLGQADKIICVSDYVRKKAVNDGADPSILLTSYSGIDLKKFQPAGDQPDLRAKLNLPQKAFVIGIVSRIKNSTDKGHRALLNVLQKYEPAKEWHLLVIGKGRGLAGLKDEAAKAGIKDRVHFLGHLTNVNEVLTCANILALPSRFETFGLVLAEAMALKKPVVAYRVGGIPELIEDGRNGFLVEQNNEEELFQKLKLLADDKELCTAMGIAGRECVETKFSCKKMMDELLAIYQSVLK